MNIVNQDLFRPKLKGRILEIYDAKPANKINKSKVVNIVLLVGLAFGLIIFGAVKVEKKLLRKKQTESNFLSGTSIEKSTSDQVIVKAISFRMREINKTEF